MGEYAANKRSALQRLAGRLFEDLEEQECFIAAVMSEDGLRQAVVWLGQAEEAFSAYPREPWMGEWADCLLPGQEPGKHRLHREGRIYCIDPSSVFAMSALASVPTHPKLIIDVCGSPGGKAICAWRILKPELIVVNEVIGKRLGALISNIRRCRIVPAAITQADTSILAKKASGSADIVVVDAPCSGQSLLAKGLKSPGCFHPVTINKNVKRQRRILANSQEMVCSRGYLGYMTCTYTPKENEQIVKWFLKNFPSFVSVRVPLLERYQSHLSDLHCYRAWPHRGQGAGAFVALFQRRANGARRSFEVSELPVIWSSAD